MSNIMDGQPHDLHDFINNSNFDQFINLVRGEEDTYPPLNPNSFINPNYDGDNLFFDDVLVANDDHQFYPNPGSTFSICSTTATTTSVLNYVNPPFSAAYDVVDDEIRAGDDRYSGDDVSATTEKPIIKRTAANRPRILVSERKRRSRMKEKLYALRSLVPNITKMDNASIVGDAVLHVQELQSQAKKLKSEIAALESLLKGEEKFQGLVGIRNMKKTQLALAADEKQFICKQIMQLDVFQLVEKTEFYVRMVCNKGDGVAAALYKALDSLPCFNIQSSNFSTVSERVVFKFTINIDVREKHDQVMELSTVKMWVIGAFVNQGFKFNTAIAS